jgi:hypothetical protein
VFPGGEHGWPGATLPGMTMYLPNDDVRPTGAELAEFIDVAPTPDAVRATPPAAPNEKVQFLQDLEEEHASISDDVLQVGEHLWAVHGTIPVDGEVLMAEFDSYDEARRTLERLREEPS